MEKSTSITILCSTNSPRLAYVVSFLSGIIGFDICIVTGKEMVKDDTCLISYDVLPKPATFSIFSSGLVFETSIRDMEPGVSKHNGQYFLFPAPEGFSINFDIFSGILYLLSRYEEYLPFKADKYGRFEAGQSLAHKKGFLHEPVIDQWIIAFQSALQNKFPHLHFPKRSYTQVATIDVDNPWAYLNKGCIRTLGGMKKQLLKAEFRAFAERMRVLTHKVKDPFDNYEYISQIAERSDAQPIYFFLSGNSGRHDTNYSLKTKAFQHLINQLRLKYPVGIHPSYKSNRSIRKLKSEYAHFTDILGHPPKISRQHFLILRLPETYRRLSELGIKKDYSMGYAGDTGFRAGTSFSFRFYDMSKEIETSIVIHPFIVMDITLQQYLKLTPKEAVRHIGELRKKVQAVNGTWTWLWHNESLSEQGVWKGWREVFEEVIKMC